jgi:DNA topoisomerase-1
MTFLVIVESPNKIKKITKLLGHEFKVMASLGHIRDLPRKSMGINLENYQAEYEITKHKVVSELRKAVKTASVVYIATDPDREGEGIAWHLMEVLKLSYPKAKRMTFNEITKSAVQAALVEANNNGRMNIDAVNSYKARRFVDKITGFKASPLLWKNITGAKSAGRVQSVATKLVTDREKDIEKHSPEEKYLISGIVLTEKKEKIHAQLKQVPDKHEEALEILEFCYSSEFIVSETSKKTVTHAPPPAFKTSVYQQEAGKRYGISPKDAMRIAQTLYEKGKITYHRTDVTRLSNQFKGEVKDYVETKYGNEYLSDELISFVGGVDHEEKKGKEKGVQAAHEAIRPTDVNLTQLVGDEFQQREKLVYKMIWTRAVASLMAKEKCHRYSIVVTLSETDKYWFTANYLLTIFLGFKILDEKHEQDKKNEVLMTVKDRDKLIYESIESRQTYTKPLNRFSESSLVKELEKRGIGRPSTYANIITTVQTRKYVTKKKSTPVKKDCVVDTLKNGEVNSKTINVDFGDKKQRLFPTSLGVKVTDFLVENLDYMMDYKFTSNLESELDEISNGEKEWKKVVSGLTQTLEKLINKVPSQEKVSKEERKMNRDARNVGKYEGSSIEFYVGEYGPFVKYKGKCHSLPKECKEISDVTVEIAVAAITKKKNSHYLISNYLISHDSEIEGKSGKIQGVTGLYGNYLCFVPDKGKTVNYFLPKDLKEDEEAVKNLTLKDCLKQVEFVTNYKKKPRKR